MNPSKAFARLTARGVQFGGVGGGGTPELTPAEIARVLRGLERGPLFAAMTKDCGDVKSIGPLEQELAHDGMRLALGLDHNNRRVRRPWPSSHSGAYVRRFAGLAVMEFLMPRSELCPKCKNRGWVKFEGQGVQCKACEGFGGTKLSSRLRADIAGVPFSRWREEWSPRYEQVYLTVNAWHSRAMLHMMRGLKALQGFEPGNVVVAKTGSNGIGSPPRVDVSCSKQTEDRTKRVTAPHHSDAVVDLTKLWAGTLRLRARSK
jgi:hypothetical protein